MRDIFRLLPTMPLWGLPGGASGKEPDCQCRRCKRFRFDPWIEKIPWRKSWQSTPVFFPGESHGQMSLEGYSPWGHKESDITEVTQQRRTERETSPESVLQSSPQTGISSSILRHVWKRIFLQTQGPPEGPNCLGECLESRFRGSGPGRPSGEP